MSKRERIRGPEGTDDAKRPKLDDDEPVPTNTTFFDHVPDEILVLILAHVDFADPANFGIMVFDRRFRRCAASAITRLHLHWSSDDDDHRRNNSDDEDMTAVSSTMPPSMSLALLNASPRLKELDLRRRGPRDSAVLARRALERCPMLQKLQGVLMSLEDKERETATRDFARALLIHGQRLQWLDLTDADFSLCGFNRRSFKPLLPQLTNLWMVNCRDVDDRVMDFVSRHCPRLEDFVLDDLNGTAPFRWSRSSERRFLRSVGDNLKEICVLSKDHSRSASFFRSLGDCKSLVSIELGVAHRMDREGIMAVTSLPLLRSLLLLETSGLSPGDIQDAFGLRMMSGLCQLSLAGSNLDDDSAEVVARSCPNLFMLDLRWCDALTDVGIADVVRHCRKVMEFALSGTGVTTNAFSDIGTLMPHLKILVVEDDDGVEPELREELASKYSSTPNFLPFLE